MQNSGVAVLHSTLPQNSTIHNANRTEGNNKKTQTNRTRNDRMLMQFDNETEQMSDMFSNG